MYANNGTLDVVGAVFLHNYAESSGAALDLVNGSTANASKAVFTSNHAYYTAGEARLQPLRPQPSACVCVCVSPTVATPTRPGWRSRL